MIGLGVLGASRPAAGAPPPGAAKILIVDDNTLDVEQAFLRPPRHERHSLALTLAGTLAAPLARGETPVAQSMLQADALLRAKRFALVSIVRLRFDDLYQPVSATRLFFHQMYVSMSHPYGEVKLGKVMGQLGRLWDYGLYGPLLANLDFKLTPDLGLSFEGDVGRGRGSWQLAYAAQYSAIDGRAISAANDTLLAARYVRRRDITTVRLVPIYRAERWRVALGVSGQAYRATQPKVAWVGRFAIDADFTAGPFESFVEVGRQTNPDTPSGSTTPAGPFNYVWAGAQVTLMQQLRLRHHVNIMRFEGDDPATDVLQQPGVEWEAQKWLTLVLEGALWSSTAHAHRGEQTLMAFAIVSL